MNLKDGVSTPASVRKNKASRRTWIWGAASAFLLLGGMLWAWLSLGQPAANLQHETGPQQVLVLYFENQTRTQELDWLREGLADMLITEFSREPKINVLSREQVASLARRAGWNTQNPPRLEEAMAMASHARAQVLLMGKFGKSGDEIRISVQVHRARDGSVLRSETASTRRVEQIIGEMGLLAGRLTRLLGSEQKVSPDSQAQLMTSNLEAYRAYSMGIQHVSVLQLAEGTQLLERAVRLDPQFAAAYAALGSAYAVSWGRAAEGKPYLEKAFSLSDRLTERQRMYVDAWYALANLDYPKAIAAFRRLVAKYPNEAEASRTWAGCWKERVNTRRRSRPSSKVWRQIRTIRCCTIFWRASTVARASSTRR